MMKLTPELLSRARSVASQCHDCSPQKLTENRGLYILPIDCPLPAGVTRLAEIGVNGKRCVIYIESAT